MTTLHSNSRDVSHRAKLCPDWRAADNFQMTRFTQLIRSLDRDAVETFAVRMLILAGGFVSSIVTARWLSPGGRGEYFLAITLAQMLAQFGNFGLQSSNTYFAAQSRQRAAALLANSIWISVVVGGLGSIAVIVAMMTGGSAMPSARLGFVVLLAPATLFYMLGTNLLVGLKRIRAYNWFQLASNYGLLLALLAAAALGAGATGFVAASALGWTVVSVALVIVCRRDDRGPLRFSPPVFAEGLRYALKAYVATLCGYLILRSNVFLLGAVAGSVPVGQFSVASQLADVIGILPQSMALVLFPTLIAAPNDRFPTMVRNLVGGGLLLGAGCVAVAIGADPFIRVVFGAKFAESATVLRWMLPSAFFLGLTSIASQYLAACGFPRAQSGVWVVGAAIAAAAGWLLIPAGGAVGAAIALSIAHFCVFAGIFGLSLLHAKQAVFAPLAFANAAEQGARS